MNEEQQQAWIAERATFLREVDDARIVMESIEIAIEDLQQNSDENGDIKSFDAIPYQVDFE